MSSHREGYEELRCRVLEEAGLGLPVPLVPPSIALLLVDCIAELGACVLELELRDALPKGSE